MSRLAAFTKNVGRSRFDFDFNDCRWPDPNQGFWGEAEHLAPMRIAWVGLAALSVCVGCQVTSRHLRVATGDSGPALAPHRQILKEFQRELPHWGTQLEPVSGGDYYTRLLTQFASQSPPDILQLGDDSVGWFAGQGCLTPLEPLLEQDGLNAQTLYFPEVLTPGRPPGPRGQSAPLFLLPKDFTPMAVYCNLRLFRQAGIEPDPNWEWEQFLDVARRLTDSQKGQYGLVVPGPRSAFFEWMVFLRQGELFSPASSSYVGAIDSAPVLEALSDYRRLYHQDRCVPLPGEMGSFHAGSNEFEEGKAAMKISGHWPLNDLRQNPNIQLAVLPLPHFRGRHCNVLYWAGFGISANPAKSSGPPDGPRVQAAWKLLKRYCLAEGSQAFSQWGLPAVKSVAEQERFQKDEAQRVWFEELHNVVPRTYTRDAFWLQVGSTAVAKLQEGVLLHPDLDLRQWASQVAREADVVRQQRVKERAWSLGEPR